MDKRRKPAIREPRPHLTMEEMRSYLTSLREIESVTGIRYIKLHVTAMALLRRLQNRQPFDTESFHEEEKK